MKILNIYQPLHGQNLQAFCEVAISFLSLGVNVSFIESECGRPQHTLMPLVKFWTSLLKLGTVKTPFFAYLTKLISFLICLLTTNTTIELFIVMGVIKTKFRNHSAIPIVEEIFATQYSLKRCIETCVLPCFFIFIRVISLLFCISFIMIC